MCDTFQGSFDEHFPLLQFSNNNSYYSSIAMAQFEVLNGGRRTYLIGCFEVGESSFHGAYLIFNTLDNVYFKRN